MDRGAIIRKRVRIRDMCCRVSGLFTPPRDCGMNFEGVEVAHIFPLAWFDMVSAVRVSGQSTRPLADMIWIVVRSQGLEGRGYP